MPRSANPAAATLYANQLIQRKEGYPLWEPDPGGHPSVQIADVGYIADGGFIRLFNASTTNGSSRTDDEFAPVPNGYVPLEIGGIRERTDLQAQFPITTGSVSEIDVSNNISGGPPGVVNLGVEFKFRSSAEEGAVLVLREDAARQDALRKLAFLNYIRKHHASWLAFSNNDINARRLTLNDLLLVTGWDKTTAWACAAFTSNSHSGGFTFQAGQAPIATSGISVWGSWRNCQAPYAHVGPSSRSRNPNQCVFIRGYKTCDRLTWLARKTHLAAPDDFEVVSPEFTLWSCFPFCCGTREKKPPQGRPNPSRSAHTQTPSWEVATQPSQLKPETETRDTSKNSCLYEKSTIDIGGVDKEKFEACLQLNHDKDPSPLDILLYYILENSKAEVAVVHDDDLISLLKKTSQNINDFERWVRDVAPTVYLDDQQVGVLETTYQVSQGEEETSIEVPALVW